MGQAAGSTGPRANVACLGGAPDESGRLGHGDLVRRDGDLELDLLADQPATLLEGDIPVESPVLAHARPTIPPPITMTSSRTARP